MATLFYIASAIVVAATILAMTRAHAVHALLYFIVSLFAMAVVFFLLGAPFVAALEVIIYAGAIMVLFLFVVMLLNLSGQAAEDERRWLRPEVWIGPGLLAFVIAAELAYATLAGDFQVAASTSVSPKEVGIELLGPYLLGVELASMLLLAGLVAAYHLGRLHTKKERQ